MPRHRFLNDGVAPIPMGPTAEYACVCGRRGTYTVIEAHIAEATTRAITRPGDQDFTGNTPTKAHYLPVVPRTPGPSTFDEVPSVPELPPPPSQILRDPSIAEAFQAMLRTAFHAGAAASVSGETFERWYQREVCDE